MNVYQSRVTYYGSNIRGKWKYYHKVGIPRTI